MHLQTDNGAGSDSSLPESWSSLNDEKCIDSVRELVNHHVSEPERIDSLLSFSRSVDRAFFLSSNDKRFANQKKELIALENELQSKVKSLNEHQSKVDKMEEELTEIAKRQKQMSHLEVRNARSQNSHCANETGNC